MSVDGGGSDPSNDIIYVNFNQAATALCVGTKAGYKLYKLEDAGKFQLDFDCRLTQNSNNSPHRHNMPAMNEEVRLVERHYLSSLVAFVKTSSPRKLVFYNFNNRAEIAIKHFSNTIHSVKLNRKIFLVCLEDSLHIFDMMLMHLAHVITNMPSNPTGICALTANNGDSFIAYPGSSTVGDIQIFDASKLLAKNTIAAHNNPIACLSFNDDGTKIASASKRGTVIRIFSVSDGNTLFEFRRGRREVSIYSLSFSPGSEYLCASSNTETVHVFKLVKDEEDADTQSDEIAESDGWMATVGKMMSYSIKYLPSQISDVLSQERSYATIHLPFYGLKNISCISRTKKMFYVFVVSSDGILYTYDLNTEGGSCTLIRQHRLDSSTMGDAKEPVKVYTRPKQSDSCHSESSPSHPSQANPSSDADNLRNKPNERHNADSDSEPNDSGAPQSFLVT